MNLDDDLHRALRRQPPPPDFVDRVMARIARDEGVKGEGGKGEGGRGKAAGGSEKNGRYPALRWLAAAAVLTLVVAGGVRYYVYQQTVAEAERVKAQIRLALQITQEKIAIVQVRLKPGTTYEPLKPDTTYERRNP